MVNYILKHDTALMLFDIKYLNLRKNYRNLLLWSKFIDSFRYDDEVVRNLVFIEHPTECFIGMSIRSSDKQLLEKKIKRYSEGLAYLLIYHFPNISARVLEVEECLSLVKNLETLNQIPRSLTKLNCEILPEARGNKVKILFVRSINPKIIFEKLLEFYTKELNQKPVSIEKRMGVKPIFDNRILDVLQNPIAAYSFTYFSNTEEFDEKLSSPNGISELPEEGFDNKFIAYMGVPDYLVDLINSAQSTSDLFDNQYLSLMSPEKVAELILN